MSRYAIALGKKPSDKWVQERKIAETTTKEHRQRGTQCKIIIGDDTIIGTFLNMSEARNKENLDIQVSLSISTTMNVNIDDFFKEEIKLEYRKNTALTELKIFVEDISCTEDNTATHLAISGIKRK